MNYQTFPLPNGRGSDRSMAFESRRYLISLQNNRITEMILGNCIVKVDYAYIK